MNFTTWKNYCEQTLIVDGDVQVWRVRLNIQIKVIEMLENLLSPDELDRANRFMFQKDRIHYIACRGQLRILLAQSTGMSPGKLQFGYNLYGKPYLVSPVSGPYFNVSHSNNLALIAISGDSQIGVDIEFMRLNTEPLQIARNFFSQHEYRQLINLPQNQQKEAFYNCWTRKEAYIKACGKGLSIPLNEFDVTLKPGEPAKIIECRHDPSSVCDWQLDSLTVPHGYIAALAVNARPYEFRLSGS
ncbi:MAG: 4'-phosphopantetheinyl transferase superfamily protein [Calditrichaceae bacterium]